MSTQRLAGVKPKQWNRTELTGRHQAAQEKVNARVERRLDAIEATLKAILKRSKVDPKLDRRGIVAPRV